MIYEIGQLAEIIDGDRGKNYPQQDEFSNSGYCLFLNTGNVTPSGFVFESNQYITQEKDSLLRKGKLRRGDIVYTTRGTVGNAAFYSDQVPYDQVRINSGMIILRCRNDLVDSRFLYQILKSNYYRPYFKQYCTGSAQPQLPIKNFSKIQLEIPEMNTQRRIADILSAYDDLLENNQKQIKLLEEAAQRLYKEWFVDLRFPGHETTPIIDGVPQGWSEKALSEFANVVMGQSPKSEFYNLEGQGLPFHQGVGSYGTRFVIDSAYSSCVTRIAECGSILFSVRAPVGRLNLTKNRIVIGRGLAAINHRFYLLKERFFKDDIIGNGSIFASISKDELLGQRFIMPTENLINRFNRIANGIDRKIAACTDQVVLLKEARDRLLPKLMNGEIEV